MSAIQPAALVPILRGLKLKSLEELQQALSSDPDSKSVEGSPGDVLRKEFGTNNHGLLNGNWTNISAAFQLLQAEASSSETTGQPVIAGNGEQPVEQPLKVGGEQADTVGDKPAESPDLGGPGRTKGVDDSGNSGSDPIKVLVSLKKDVETGILSGYKDVPNIDNNNIKIVTKDDGKVYATLKTDLEEMLPIKLEVKDSDGNLKKIELEISQDSGSMWSTGIKVGAIVLGLLGALVAGTSSDNGKGWLGVLGGVVAAVGALAFKSVRDAVFFFDKSDSK